MPPKQERFKNPKCAIRVGTLSERLEVGPVCCGHGAVCDRSGAKKEEEDHLS